MRMWLIITMVLTSCLSAMAEKAPAVMLLHGRGTDWGAVRELEAQSDLVFGACGFGELTWERLQEFNVVILFDMSRYEPETKGANDVTISPDGFERVAGLLERFVREGGGLYVYGVSFTHMGQGWATETLNRFLRRFDAQVLFELLRDEPREQRQPGGRKLLYAQPDEIVSHPATAGVKHLWYAIGPFSYGPWTRPLKLGADWQPLIFTSRGFTSTPLKDPAGHAQPVTDVPTAVVGERAVILAVRSLDKGRIVLSGGESTISFYGYAFSEYADREWQRIGMEKGLNGIPSDGRQLLISNLQWLAQPSLEAGVLGGFTPPPVKAWEPRQASPIAWPAQDEVKGRQPFRKGVIGVMPAGCGGSGSVAEYATAAREAGLDYLVFAADFERADEAAWTQLQTDCAAVTSETFVATPAVITQDHLDNWFLQTGSRAWPRHERLDPGQPQRVRDHLGYWMVDGNFPMRVVFRFSDGGYPSWLHSGYESFGVRTWKDGKMIDQDVEGFLHNQMQGDRARIVSISLVTSPDQLAEVREHTWILAPNAERLADALVASQFSGGAASYVSSGPRVLFWHVGNARRNTFGEAYVAGTERWRLSLAAESDIPLKQVTLYDGTRLFRRFAVDGNSCELMVDGLHGERHVLTAMIEDVQGNQAMTGAIEVQDGRLVQTFCSDRCNIMGGSSVIRDRDGRETTVPASAMLYKAGRLSASTVGIGEALPGIDGSGQGVEYFLGSSLFLNAADEQGEARGQVHRIERPWESADGLIFDTPIAMRSPVRDHLIFGHNPYVALEEPRVDARLTQYHFYRSPMYPSPAMADFSLTAREAVTPVKGWQGFSAQMGNAWGKHTRYMVFKNGAMIVDGPSEDEAINTTWRGNLAPGDFVYLPDLGEGFFSLGRAGDAGIDVVIECIPSRGWFRTYVGRFDLSPLAAGEEIRSRVLLMRSASRGEEGLQQWLDFARRYGLLGEPAYTLALTRGERLSDNYLLDLQAVDGAIAGSFDIAMLPQRLPVKVNGIHPNWTAAKVDNERRTWHPLGGWEGAIYTTLDPALGRQELFIGNLLTCDQPELHLTFLPQNRDAGAHVAVHNPTATPLRATVKVPTATWLAPAQSHLLDVPAFATVNLPLQQENRP